MASWSLPLNRGLLCLEARLEGWWRLKAIYKRGGFELGSVAGVFDNGWFYV